MEDLSSQTERPNPRKLPDVLCGCGLSLNNLNVTEKKMCCSKFSPFESLKIASSSSPSGPSPLYIGREFNARINSPLAVDVNNLSLTYGGHEGTKVLDNFSMKVPYGAIYSLLGSSGCGKTTLLQCIVGLKRWDSGCIKTLGVPPCKDEEFFKIRQQIGYQPQDLALYDHLTIIETLKYYSKLYDISPEDFMIRWTELRKLLGLSSKRCTPIKDLSGGTKRRVSLALALLSKPKLLILDEPTVGLDPLARTSIWGHLCKLIRTKQCAILLTTHYVEETRFSDRIGIMRNGRILAEDSPESLLSTYQSNLLEDVILQICKNDQNDQILSGKNYTNMLQFSRRKEDNLKEVVCTHLRCNIDLQDQRASNNAITFNGYLTKGSNEFHHPARNENLYMKSNMTAFIHDAYREEKQRLVSPLGIFESYKRIKKSIKRTLSFSNIMWIYLMRQPMFAFILVFLPVIQLLMTFFVVGTVPMGLNVGIINLEVLELNESNPNFCQNVSFLNYTQECDLTFLSCHIQNQLSSSRKLNLITLTNREQAEEMIQQGSLLGYIIFPKNYSENLVNRFITGKFASDNDTLEGSKLRVTLEKSHYLGYYLILKEVLDSLDNLSKSIEGLCRFDNSYNEIPLHFRQPVYGRLDGTHQESIIPAIVAQIIFEILYGIAPMILIKDLRQGTFVRSNLAGLQYSEFMQGIFVTMAPILILQSVSCYVVLDYVFGFKVKGSMILFVALCLLAGLCGQAFGIFMGTLLKSEFSVIVSAIMVVPIIMTCSGTLWPLESHPYYLTIIYYVFPSALIVSSLRSVINRGVGLTHSLVWPGFANTLSWSLAFWLLSIYGFRRMTKS